ncbi:MAG: alpha/beta fold hydrolase [Saprospiraceae bacterium]|jgi:predicted alpha/beta-fold hydrolase
MPLLNAQYKPGWLFKNGHVNTLFPYLFRKKPSLSFIRERIDTPENDFFDVDWIHKDKNSKLVILMHGLEGSSASQYINGISRLLVANKYTVAAINFRSCSGELNRTVEMYHSGFTKDLHHFLTIHGVHYTDVFICGFSLGGNVTLKYAGDGFFTVPPNIRAVVGISVPIDLQGGSYELKKWYNQMYEKQFLYTLLPKMKQKHQMMPDKIDISHLHKVKTLWDFDEYFTAKLHGMIDANDYYNTCSSLQHLNKIRVPTLLINALDDSFLSPTCYPYDIAQSSDIFHLMTPKHGGHVGFTSFGKDYYWTELKVLEFLQSHLSDKKQ